MSEQTTKTKFVVRRDGKLVPLTGCVSRAEADARIEKEITGGNVKEIDLYVYVGTARQVRIVDMTDDLDVPLKLVKGGNNES